MASPSFVHDFRRLKPNELAYLINHLKRSGTKWDALGKFSNVMFDLFEPFPKSPFDGPWVIPLPSRDNGPSGNDLYYVIGKPPKGFVNVEEQCSIFDMIHEDPCGFDYE